MKIARSALCLIVCLTGIFFVGKPALAQKQPIKMTVGYSASGGQYMNLFVAKDLGIFDKHGLDVTLHRLNSSSQSVAAIRSGSVQVDAGPGGVQTRSATLEV